MPLPYVMYFTIIFTFHIAKTKAESQATLTFRFHLHLHQKIHCLHDPPRKLKHGVIYNLIYHSTKIEFLLNKMSKGIVLYNMVFIFLFLLPILHPLSITWIDCVIINKNLCKTLLYVVILFF